MMKYVGEVAHILPGASGKKLLGRVRPAVIVQFDEPLDSRLRGVRRRPSNVKG